MQLPHVIINETIFIEALQKNLLAILQKNIKDIKNEFSWKKELILKHIIYVLL